jgi:hypothetical protein
VCIHFLWNTEIMCIILNFKIPSKFFLIIFIYFLKFVYYQKHYYINVIIIIIIIILVITFMQGIYNYTPETNHVSTVYSVAAVLYLQSVLHVMAFRPLTMFCTFTLALPAVWLQCQLWLFSFLVVP